MYIFHRTYKLILLYIRATQVLKIAFKTSPNGAVRHHKTQYEWGSTNPR